MILDIILPSDLERGGIEIMIRRMRRMNESIGMTQSDWEEIRRPEEYDDEQVEGYIKNFDYAAKVLKCKSRDILNITEDDGEAYNKIIRRINKGAKGQKVRMPSLDGSASLYTLTNGVNVVITNEWGYGTVFVKKSEVNKAINESVGFYGRRRLNESKASINYSYYNSVNPIDLLAEHLEQDLYKLCDEVTDFNCKLSMEKDVKKAASYGYKDLIAKRRLAYTKIKVIDYIPSQSNHEVICDFDILDAEYNIYDKNYADLFEPLLKKASECRLAQIEAIKKYNEQNDYTDTLIAFKRASRARGVEMGKDALFSRVTRYPDTAYRVRDALTSDSIPGVTYINSKQVRQKEFYFFKINKKGTKGFLSIEASGRSYSWAVYCGDRIKKELALYGLSLNESYGRRRMNEGYSRNSSRRINENAILSNFKSVVSYARDSYVNENYHSEILESMNLRSYLMSRGEFISGANYPMNEATNVTDAKIIKDGNGTAISVKINGKEYRYVSATKSTADLFRSFNGMLKNGYAGYKALNWLKKNALEYYASKKPSEEGRKLLGLSESRRFSHRFAY